MNARPSLSLPEWTVLTVLSQQPVHGSGEQLQRVTGYLESGRADGATAVTGGGRHGDRGTSSSRPS